MDNKFKLNHFWQRQSKKRKAWIVSGGATVALVLVGGVLPQSGDASTDLGAVASTVEIDDDAPVTTARKVAERAEPSPTTVTTVPKPSVTTVPPAKKVVTRTETSIRPAPAPSAPATTAPPAVPEVAAETAAALTVSRVVDGDTVEMSDGSTIRLIGIDTPEQGQCGYAEAAAHLELVLVFQAVTLTPGARDDVDKYGRLLRYLDLGNGTDANLAMIESGHTIARYDSRDGYGRHARQDAYVAADATNRNPVCATRTASTPTAKPAPAKPGTGTAPHRLLPLHRLLLLHQHLHLRQHLHPHRRTSPRAVPTSIAQTSGARCGSAAPTITASTQTVTAGVASRTADRDVAACRDARTIPPGDLTTS